MGYDDRQGREHWRGGNRGRDGERGFFERAGDEVRSWFVSDDDERGRPQRREDERGWRREEDRGPGWRGDESFGGGWGNQRPRAQSLGDRGRDWQDDRAPERYGGAFEEGYGSGERGLPTGGGATDFYPGPGHDSEFAGPRFDRADVGSTGTHGVHPVASSSGLASQGYGTSAAGYSSSARRYAMLDRDRERSSGGHDPHYSEWRRRQIEQLDRDYEDYCREHQSRFEQEFGAWREQRRSNLSKVRDQMKVVGSDGSPVGTVDEVAGDRIVLTRSDSDAGGMHHSIPCSWIDSVENEVRLNRSAEEALREWRGEEESGAMFRTPREQEGHGARNLDRSFSGTY